MDNNTTSVWCSINQQKGREHLGQCCAEVQKKRKEAFTYTFGRWSKILSRAKRHQNGALSTEQINHQRQSDQRPKTKEQQCICKHCCGMCDTISSTHFPTVH